MFLEGLFSFTFIAIIIYCILNMYKENFQFYKNPLIGCQQLINRRIVITGKKRLRRQGNVKQYAD